jgi:hypothetical protein
MYPPRICRNAARPDPTHAIAWAPEPFGSHSLVISEQRRGIVLDAVEVDPPDVDGAQTGE